MIDFLTKRQVLFLEYANEKGLVTTIDIKRFYTTLPLEQLQRLVDLGYLEEDLEHFGHFKPTGKEFK